MRAAPAVWVPLDDCRPERVLIAVLYGATGAALATWGMAHSGGGAAWPQPGLAAGLVAGLVAGLAGLLGLAVGRRLLPGDVAALGWDGQAWALQPRPAAGQVVVVDQLQWLIDLGPWLLLRARCGPGRPRWLVLRQSRVGPAWHLLRVALTAHAVAAKGRR